MNLKEKIIRPVTFVLILIFALIIYRNLIVPQRNGFGAMKRSLMQIDSQLNSVLGEDSAQRDGNLQKDALEKELEKLVLKIPSERDFPRIVDQILSKVGKGLSLDYSLVEPKEMQNEGKYKKIPLELKFSAVYQNFIYYLIQLERLPIATRIETLSMRRLPEKPDRLEIHLLLSAFVMPEEDTLLITQPSVEARRLSDEPSLNPFSPKGMPKKSVPKTPEARIMGEKERMLREEDARYVDKTPVFTLQGTLGQDEENLGAIINDTIVYRGDYLRGFLVIKVSKSSATLKKGDKTIKVLLIN